ncbi:malonate decarboxylase holo-ACP synthase [Paraburkholderia sp. DGU8]|uniref:malonate decarboxylase holo-ACP synthase n=1 Tax=Paraburkholderia sp. DGU8 TaxID=3161997 RepID=UPI003467212F
MRARAAAAFVGGHTSSRDVRWRPHDLLRLRRLPACDDEPAWVRAAFERAPYAVVRRALTAEGVVAVGLRGAGRAQRYGTWAEAGDIESVVPPEALLQAEPLAGREALRPFAALADLRSDAAGALAVCAWGPTGSAGFELATRVPAVTESSDLDLLIRAPEPLTQDIARAWLDQMHTLAARAGIRVDAQLETPAGGVALAEWAAGKARVLARDASGPRLIANPWGAAHGTPNGAE